MTKRIAFSLFFAMVAPIAGADGFEADVISTSAGELRITFIGHASIMFQYGGKVIQVDPYGKLADYSQFPKADLVLITHEHGDHLDAAALDAARNDRTLFVANQASAERLHSATVMHNGDTQTVLGFPIEAVAAYNINHKRDNGQPFHPKGAGNGYIITFGDVRVYVAGDTENTPEMKSLRNIDVAFLPMNLPYTMTPEMVADAVRAFRPKILYPYHFGDTDTSRLVTLLQDEKGIDIRVRKMP